MKLTGPQRQVLAVLGDAGGWVRSGSKTHGFRPHKVHSRVARSLERLGLVESRTELPDGEPIRGAQLVEHFGDWHITYAISPAGTELLAKLRDA